MKPCPSNIFFSNIQQHLVMLEALLKSELNNRTFEVYSGAPSILN